jgi:hypothetical protein
MKFYGTKTTYSNFIYPTKNLCASSVVSLTCAFCSLLNMRSCKIYSFGLCVDKAVQSQSGEFLLAIKCVVIQDLRKHIQKR